MTFETLSIFREYRGEWVSGNAADPYMAGETVSYLGSVYHSAVNNNMGNIGPDIDPNWILSARGAQLSAVVNDLIGTTENPVTYGSIISGASGNPVVVPPGSPGQVLTSSAGSLSYTGGTTGTGRGLEEVFTHFSSHQVRDFGGTTHESVLNNSTDVDLAITSNNKICVINHDGTTTRVFDKDVIPRGEINGVREAVWADRAAFYVIDINNNLWIQNRHDGNVRMITDNVRNIATSFYVTPGSSAGVNPTNNRVVICKMDGTVFGYGSNASRFLVPNESTNLGFLDPPVQITGLTDIQRVFSAQASNTYYASDSMNQLFSWGDNGRGQAGRSPATVVSPAVIVQNFQDFVSHAAFDSTNGELTTTSIFAVSTLQGESGAVILWFTTDFNSTGWQPNQNGVSIPSGVRSIFFRNFVDASPQRWILHVISNDGLLYTGGAATLSEMLRGLTRFPSTFPGVSGIIDFRSLDLSTFSGSITADQSFGYVRSTLVNNEIDHVVDVGGVRGIIRRGQIIIPTARSGTVNNNRIAISETRYGGFFPSEIVDVRGRKFLLADGTILIPGLPNIRRSTFTSYRPREYYLGRLIYVT